MKELPEDLAAMDPDDLIQQGAVRDDLLTPLFRRWPRLDRVEGRRLREIYSERVRIAKYLGRLGRPGLSVSFTFSGAAHAAPALNAASLASTRLWSRRR